MSHDHWEGFGRSWCSVSSMGMFPKLKPSFDKGLKINHKLRITVNKRLSYYKELQAKWMLSTCNAKNQLTLSAPLSESDILFFTVKYYGKKINLLHKSL